VAIQASASSCFTAAERQALADLQKTGIVVVDEGGLPVHHSPRSAHHAAAKHLANALVAHAHAKHRHLWAQSLDYVQGDA
jgi:hypothetical protein